MDKEGNYPIVVFDETEKFINSYNTDNKKSFEIKVDSFFENLRAKTKVLEDKEIEITGKELITYSLSQIDCNPAEFNVKNIAVKLKNKIQLNTEYSNQLNLLWEFLFLIDNNYDINQKFVFTDKEKNRDKNEYDLVSFRDDVIYYFCRNIKNKKNVDKELLNLIIYAYLRITKNQY